MKIYLIGIGPGRFDLMTGEAQAAVMASAVAIGSRRALETLPAEFSGEKAAEYMPEKILAVINEHEHAEAISVLMTGDIGFYSGAAKLLSLLGGRELVPVCGVSSVQYFAAKLGEPWQNWRLLSAHGAAVNVVAEACSGDAVFLLTGGAVLPDSVIGELCAAGLGEAEIAVGEDLSYEGERITHGTASQLAKMSFSPLSVMLIRSKKTFNRKFVTQGISDVEFTRGDVPMTKQEVRAVALAKLRVAPEDTVWDVGAGTGSVSVEAALLARRGRIFAVETEADACALIAENREKFGVYNLSVVRGFAPEALADLPAPNAVFVGGTKGNLEGILSAAREKEPSVRVVVTAVTLETLAAANETLRRMGFSDVDVVEISVTRTRKAGSYNLFSAQNPVYILSGEGGGNG